MVKGLSIVLILASVTCRSADKSPSIVHSASAPSATITDPPNVSSEQVRVLELPAVFTHLDGFSGFKISLAQDGTFRTEVLTCQGWSWAGDGHFEFQGSSLILHPESESAEQTSTEFEALWIIPWGN